MDNNVDNSNDTNKKQNKIDSSKSVSEESIGLPSIDYISFSLSNIEFSEKRYNKIYCAISYIPFLWILSLIIDKGNANIKFHINQGIILNTAYLAVSLIIYIISVILLSASPVLVFISIFISVIIQVFLLVFIVIGFYNSFSSRNIFLPFIGDKFDFFK